MRTFLTAGWVALLTLAPVAGQAAGGGSSCSCLYNTRTGKCYPSGCDYREEQDCLSQCAAARRKKLSPSKVAEVLEFVIGKAGTENGAAGSASP